MQYRFTNLVLSDISAQVVSSISCSLKLEAQERKVCIQTTTVPPVPPWAPLTCDTNM